MGLYVRIFKIVQFWSNVLSIDQDNVYCLKNNGYLSSRITMERGIRQGCPVSALLFILVVEVLAINIRENKNIHGLGAAFMHKKKYIKLSKYADDCTVFLKNKANIK